MEFESKYYVSWGREITALSPEEAARKALSMQRDPEAAASARILIVHESARELSVELSASGNTAHVLWDSDHQEEVPDAEYTPEFWALPPERQLQWRISGYLVDHLSRVHIPNSEGWHADGLLDTDDKLSGPVGFLVRTTGPSFKVTVELCEEDDSRPSNVTGE